MSDAVPITAPTIEPVLLDSVCPACGAAAAQGQFCPTCQAHIASKRGLINRATVRAEGQVDVLSAADDTAAQAQARLAFFSKNRKFYMGL